MALYAQNSYSFIAYEAGDLVGDSDALLHESRDSKAMAQGEKNTLYSLKVEALSAVLAQFPETYDKMKQAAQAKRQRHARKIA